MSKTAFVLSSTAILLCICFCLFFLMGIVFEKYAAEETLVYEEYTFVKYERKRSGKSSVRHEIYVEELEAPLVISSIALHQTNREALSGLEQGDRVTASIYAFKDEWGVYAISCNGVSILSYEEYVSRNRENDRVGIVLLSVVSVAFIGGLIVNIDQYVNKRKHRRKRKRYGRR